MKRISVLLAALSLGGCATAPTEEPISGNNARTLVTRMETSLAETLIDNGIESLSSNLPELATRLGDSRPSWNPPNAEAIRQQALIDLADQLTAAVDTTQIPRQLRHDIMHLVYGAAVSPVQAVIDPAGGPHISLPLFLKTVHPLESLQDATDYIARIDAMAAYAESLTQGTVRLDAETLQAQCDELMASGAGRLVEDIDLRTWRASFRSSLVIDALEEQFRQAISKTCLAVKSAREFEKHDTDYRKQLLRYTSREIAPGVIYEAALEVLDAAYAEVTTSSPDKQLDEQTLLDTASAALFDYEARSAALTGRNAAVDLDLGLLDEATDLASSAPGRFVRSENLGTVLLSPRYTALFGIEATALRYSIPGAHLIPFTPISAIVPVPAVSEGWPLYAITRLDVSGANIHVRVEAVRAAADIGIHVQGWSRDRAGRFVREHLPFDDAFARQLVNGVVAKPASGTAAFTGHLMFTELEAEARLQLGPDFSMPAFVDALIGEGERPYAVIRERVTALGQAAP